MENHNDHIGFRALMSRIWHCQYPLKAPISFKICNFTLDKDVIKETIMKSYLLSTAAVVAILAATPAFATDHYASTTGSNNSQSCTLSLPCKTISKCERVSSPGDRCLVKGGTYSETVAMISAGTMDHPIVVKPFDSTPVIIDGSGGAPGTDTVDIGVSYITLSGGFEIKGGKRDDVRVFNGAVGVIVDGNNIHDGAHCNVSIYDGAAAIINNTISVGANALILTLDSITKCTGLSSCIAGVSVGSNK
jgi:hypothetical protein